MMLEPGAEEAMADIDRTAPPEPEVANEVYVAPEEDDDFGLGLLEDEAKGPDNPPVLPQTGYSRKTEPGDEEGFGLSLIHI